VLVGGVLVCRHFQCLSATPTCRFAIHQSVAALAGLLLLAGLWTPVSGLIVAGIEAGIALSAPATAGIPIVLAVLGLTLAMIGPGTWSTRH
jgi:putative oxidoreductase